MIHSLLRLTLAFLLLTTSALAQQATPTAAELVQAFSGVKGVPEWEPRSFEFSASGYKYEISRDGRGVRTGGGTAARRFNLRLDHDSGLQATLYYAEHERDLLLMGQIGDIEYASGFIARLDGRTLRLKWKRSLPGFNVGAGLIEGQYAYVTTIGFVGKVDLQSGAFAWKHHDLYSNEEAHFNSFRLPALEANSVLFKEEPVSKKPPKTIKVDKRSGKILSITSQDGPL